jgi:hypothetical protein
VFLWNKGTTEPTTPNYTLTKSVPSPTQTDIAWNVSNFAKEFIKPIAPVAVKEPTEEDVKCWCYMKVVRYSDDAELDDETFVCLNGYTNYSSGYNNDSTDNRLILRTNILHKYNSNYGYFNIIITGDSEFPLNVVYKNLANIDLILTGGEIYNYKIPFVWNDTFTNEIILTQEDTFANILVEQICEPKYTPITCTFINRFGGWQYLTFFKANQQGIDVKSKDYNLLPSSIDYNPLQGQKQRFNFQGTQKIKCNTGWVDENYSELIQDLMLSEVVLLDNKPAVVKSQSFDIKTHLKDKNINYEVEFEYNYGLINDVI